MLPWIYQQPNPLQKFVYDSLVRKKSHFENEYILLNHTRYEKVSIEVDLYSQMDPPLLSPHILRKNSNRNMKFITDTMDQVEENNTYYKYILSNCHIKRTSNARKKDMILEKLQDKKSWELGRPLNSHDRECFENIVALDYFDVVCGKKVYVGFTPYVYNEETNCKVKLSDTTFSHAIYDSSEFSTVAPCCGSISGGSEHLLKINNCLSIEQPHTSTVRLKLSDEENSWQAVVLGRLKKDGICFILPPYTGTWNLHDQNRLINLQVLDVVEGLPSRFIKLVYV